MTEFPVRHFMSEVAVAHVGEGLLSRILPRAEWTHEAHLAATTYIVLRHPEIDLDVELPGIIRGYNESVGGVSSDKEGYHDTITRAYLRGIRLFLAYASALAAIPTLGRRAEGRVIRSLSFADDPFTLGVASGDPDHRSVVLWTRLAPKPLEPFGGMPAEIVEVAWEVANDESLSDVVARGTALATPQLGHSVHVEVDALKPDRWYYYRFRAGDAQSVRRVWPRSLRSRGARSQDQAAHRRCGRPCHAMPLLHQRAHRTGQPGRCRCEADHGVDLGRRRDARRRCLCALDPGPALARC